MLEKITLTLKAIRFSFRRLSINQYKNRDWPADNYFSIIKKLPQQLHILNIQYNGPLAVDNQIKIKTISLKQIQTGKIMQKYNFDREMENREKRCSPATPAQTKSVTRVTNFVIPDTIVGHLI